MIKGINYIRLTDNDPKPIVTPEDLDNALKNRCESLFLKFFEDFQLSASVNFKNHKITLLKPSEEDIDKIKNLLGSSDNATLTWQTFPVTITYVKENLGIILHVPKQDIIKGTACLKNLPVFLSLKLGKIEAVYNSEENCVEFNSDNLTIDSVHKAYAPICNKIKVNLLISKINNHFKITLQQ